MTYFHCASLPLSPGSVICPGNWGRIIRQYQANEHGTYQVAFRERLLEDVRSVHFPNKPSRLSSCFVLLTLQDAKQFQLQFQRMSIIYEVEPVMEPDTIHRGNYTAVIPSNSPYYFDRQREAAMAYWTDEPQQYIEVLLPVPIRIVRCVDDLAPDLPGLRG